MLHAYHTINGFWLTYAHLLELQLLFAICSVCSFDFSASHHVGLAVVDLLCVSYILFCVCLLWLISDILLNRAKSCCSCLLFHACFVVSLLGLKVVRLLVCVTMFWLGLVGFVCCHWLL